jgi:hypothetical protein
MRWLKRFFKKYFVKTVIKRTTVTTFADGTRITKRFINGRLVSSSSCNVNDINQI